MIQIYSDFDGTVTNRDSIVFLTERFGAGPEFRRKLLADLKSGKISLSEVIRREMQTVRISWPRAVAALREEVWVDPVFPEFVQWCRDRGYPLSVVSAGLEPVLSLYLGDLGVPFSAHPVEVSRKGWIYQPRRQSDKVAILSRARHQGPVVYIGDGTSDVSVIPWVDLLFAKDYLARYCQKEKVPYIGFQTFRDVQAFLEGSARHGAVVG